MKDWHVAIISALLSFILMRLFVILEDIETLQKSFMHQELLEYRLEMIDKRINLLEIDEK